mmetsp:Transcript_34885/g.100217  ORF Transcript_34885/g.100217 Transcript_34885/m.100217 type:complete len:86 (-) Transcript_34885:79-336(-)
MDPMSLGVLPIASVVLPECPRLQWEYSQFSFRKLPHAELRQWRPRDPPLKRAECLARELCSGVPLCPSDAGGYVYSLVGTMLFQQ